MGGDHHDHDHHHHGPPYTVPDAKIYKVEGNPELEAIQRYLATKGLRDPWLRNEVWRHDVQFSGPRRSTVTKWTDQIFRGFRYGLAATVVVVGLESAYNAYKGPDEHHEHDHH